MEVRLLGVLGGTRGSAPPSTFAPQIRSGAQASVQGAPGSERPRRRPRAREGGRGLGLDTGASMQLCSLYLGRPRDCALLLADTLPPTLLLGHQHRILCFYLMNCLDPTEE